MPTNFERSPLTDLIVARLGAMQFGTLTLPVDKGRAPEAGGWQGEPNKPGSRFVPYLVVMPMTANASSGPIGSSQADWQIPYSIQGFGVLYDQTEKLLDKVRAALSDLKGETHLFGDSNYKIQQVRTESIGGIVRIDATDPPYWGQQDGITVWITKEL